MTIGESSRKSQDVQLLTPSQPDIVAFAAAACGVEAAGGLVSLFTDCIIAHKVVNTTVQLHSC